MTPLSKERRAELRAKAEAATRVARASWRYLPAAALHSGWVCAEDGPVVAVVQWPVPTADHAVAGVDPSKPVGEHIAAADPATVIALPDHINALEAALRPSEREAKDMVGLIAFLEDVAASNREMAADVVGGQRHRLLAEAGACDSWVAALLPGKT